MSSSQKKADHRLRRPRSAAAERMATFRRRMREQGMRPVQIWVNDSRSPDFVAKCQRQARAAHLDAAGERDLLDWVGAARDWSDV
jgi:hypothetical protein